MKEQIQKELKEKFIEGGYSEGVGFDDAISIQNDDAYIMPDEELKAKILEALHEDNHVEDSNIDVDVNYGEITLTGTVRSRDMMNAARECVERVSGVKKIVNDLEIRVE